MIKRIILIQSVVCIIMLLCYMAAGKFDSEIIQEKRSQAVAAMSKHYTVSDIWDKGKSTASALIKVPAAVSSYVMSAQDSQRYAEPIDPVAVGGITSIYAVSGGQVIETGENEELGKFIRIQHDGAVSVYGQCSRIYAKEGKHVRRGQVIGSFLQEENNEFYYDLIEE